jgi:hypothetical protein
VQEETLGAVAAETVAGSAGAPDGTVTAEAGPVAAGAGGHVLVAASAGPAVVTLAGGVADGGLLSRMGTTVLINSLNGWSTPQEQAGDQVFAGMASARFDGGVPAFRTGPHDDGGEGLAVYRLARLRPALEEFDRLLWDDTGSESDAAQGVDAWAPTTAPESNGGSAEQDSSAPTEE